MIASGFLKKIQMDSSGYGINLIEILIDSTFKKLYLNVSYNYRLNHHSNIIKNGTETTDQLTGGEGHEVDC